MSTTSSESSRQEEASAWCLMVNLTRSRSSRTWHRSAAPTIFRSDGTLRSSNKLDMTENLLYRMRATAGIAALVAAGTTASAQGYPFSQRGSVSQTIAFTTIKITYGRPVARGRELFGALVPWDSIWHPGADSATRLVLNHDALIEGQPVKAGEYSVWLIPHEHAAWTIILNRRAHVFHKPYPGSGSDALRVDVMPEQVSPVESLEYSFPTVLRDAATLRVQWGTTAVPIQIKAPYRPRSSS